MDRVFVTDVCREAGVSRGTFYLHYSDVMDVAKDIVRVIDENCVTMPTQLQIYRWGYCPRGKPLCIFLREHKEYKPLLADPVLRKQIVDYIVEEHNKFVGGVGDHSDMTESQLRGLYAFQISGCVEAIYRYMDCSDEEWAEIQKSIDMVLKEGLDKRVYRGALTAPSESSEKGEWPPRGGRFSGGGGLRGPGPPSSS